MILSANFAYIHCKSFSQYSPKLQQQPFIGVLKQTYSQERFAKIHKFAFSGLQNISEQLASNLMNSPDAVTHRGAVEQDGS